MENDIISILKKQDCDFKSLIKYSLLFSSWTLPSISKSCNFTGGSIFINNAFLLLANSIKSLFHLISYNFLVIAKNI